MEKRGSGLNLQYLATLSLIFVTGSRVLEPPGLVQSILFTSAKYSMNTLCFTMGICGKSQVGLLEKGTDFPFINYLLIWFFSLHKKVPLESAEISEIIHQHTSGTGYIL